LAMLWRRVFAFAFSTCAIYDRALELELSPARGDVATLQARLAAYAITGGADRPSGGLLSPAFAIARSVSAGLRLSVILASWLPL